MVINAAWKRVGCPAWYLSLWSHAIVEPSNCASSKTASFSSFSRLALVDASGVAGVYLLKRLMPDNDSHSAMYGIEVRCWRGMPLSSVLNLHYSFLRQSPCRSVAYFSFCAASRNLLSHLLFVWYYNVVDTLAFFVCLLVVNAETRNWFFQWTHSRQTLFCHKFLHHRFAIDKQKDEDRLWSKQGLPLCACLSIYIFVGSSPCG